MENEIFRVGNDTARVYRCNTAVVAAVRQDSMQLTAFGNWDSTIFC